MTATPSLPRRSAAEQARVETLLQEMFEHRIRFNEVLGLRVESFDPANPRLVFAMRPELVGHYLHGRLHGGSQIQIQDVVSQMRAQQKLRRQISHQPAIGIS